MKKDSVRIKKVGLFLAVLSAFSFIASTTSKTESTMHQEPKHWPSLKRDYPVQPVYFTRVQLTDTFWKQRLETNRQASIPFAFKMCEETGRIDNFAKAGGLMDGPFKGQFPFDDTDAYKIIEGASYSLTTHPDPALEKYLDHLIGLIAAAQEEDGYLYTGRTIDPENPVRWAGKERWSNLVMSHELYNAGHLYESAVAHFLATGKRTYLEVAVKNADLIDQVFGPDKKRTVPGHQIIEMGLVRLYRITGNEKYLKLAKFFLDERGRANGRTLYMFEDNPGYSQDHKPVIEQEEAVGHAVRATYMYCGMADVAALTGDTAYVKAIDRLWENVVGKKLYLTGGIGARHKGEAFGDNYELPDLTAYNETCAAIGNAMWNHRMFLLHGDSRYIDVLERIIYNGFLSGVSLSGDLFFYTNPLESDGQFLFNEGTTGRQPWFGCACCPGNVTRFMPSIPGYMYAVQQDTIYVNLFINSTSVIQLGKNTVTLNQKTTYPWDGNIKISVEPQSSGRFTVNMRIPGWSLDRPVPGDLYTYVKRPEQEDIYLAVNGARVKMELHKGYAALERAWKKGDVIEMNLPMPVRMVQAHPALTENMNKMALERGPLVYCFEWADNRGKVSDIMIPDQPGYKTQLMDDKVLGKLMVIRGSLLRKNAADKTVQEEVTAIPYFAWAHRGAGEMAVWIKTKKK